MAKFIKAVIAIAVALLLGLMFLNAGKEYKKSYNREYKGTYTGPGTDVEVTIPEDASDREVAAILKDKGLIKHITAFTRRLDNSQYDGKIVAGTYTLNTGMNTLSMMEIMSPVQEHENGVLQTLVVPEGFTIDQIAARCAEQDICTAEEFKNAVQSITTADFPYLADVPDLVDVRYRLEGYLFPATYNIYETTTANSLVHDMLSAFNGHYTAEMQAEAEGMGYSSYEVLTRASMVEREAKLDYERPIIASVINNRLKSNMLLQIDSTILYPMTEGKYDVAKVSNKDLEYDSPYNTYLHSGLPAGPICNPGAACINAVLNPDQGDYLFYHVVDESTGQHGFWKTQEEFDASFENGDMGIPATSGDANEETAE